jgi:hypothetical protein
LLNNTLKQYGVNKYQVKNTIDEKSILELEVGQFQQQRILSTEAHKTQFTHKVLDAWRAFVLNCPIEEFVAVHNNNEHPDFN